MNITATAEGVQAHSSTGKGRNANWELIPFLAEMRELARRLRDDPAFRDAAYDPPFPDFNLVIDNHGTAVNVTVARATCRIKFRAAAASGRSRCWRPCAPPRSGPAFRWRSCPRGTRRSCRRTTRWCASARSCPARAPATVPFGTDAVALQALAPCVVLGPGDIGLAHTPEERVPVAELAAAVPLMARFLERGAAA
jgi:acetylornithine deacetylase